MLIGQWLMTINLVSCCLRLRRGEEPSQDTIREIHQKMSFELCDLQTELQLMIIEELLAAQCTDEQDNDAKIKCQRDLINWSCTSSYFRSLLTPYLFKIVRLRNDERSGSSITAIANSEHHKSVKELHFVGSAPGLARREEEAFSDITGIFPNNVNTLLSDLQGSFPNLETLSIEFAYQLDDDNEWEEGIDLIAVEESAEEVKAAEESEAWRALMVKTYEALLRNKEIHFKALKIRQLIPNKISTFSSQSFHRFLSHIERFSLSLYGQDDGSYLFGVICLFRPSFSLAGSKISGDRLSFTHLYACDISRYSINQKTQC